MQNMQHAQMQLHSIENILCQVKITCCIFCSFIRCILHVLCISIFCSFFHCMLCLCSLGINGLRREKTWHCCMRANKGTYQCLYSSLYGINSIQTRCMQNLNVLTYICSWEGCFDPYLGPELQCLLRVKEDLSKVLIFQDAKNNFYNWLKSK